LEALFNHNLNGTSTITIVNQTTDQNVSVIAFDMDGVLIDSAKSIEASLFDALEMHDIPIADDFDLKAYVGKPLEELILLASAVPISGSQVGLCARSYRLINDSISSSELTVYPGVVEMLGLSAELFPLCVLTTKNENSAKRQLKMLELSKFFVGIFGNVSDIKHVSKDVRWTEAERELSRDKTVTIPLIVGDRASDIAAAKQLGRLSIGVKWGYGSLSELDDASADRIAERPSAIPSLLQELCN